MAVKDYIEERAVEIAGYIVETKATVRQAAKKFGISKSTVHKDCVERLKLINPALAVEVRKVLDVNDISGVGLLHGKNICMHICGEVFCRGNVGHKVPVFMNVK